MSPNDIIIVGRNSPADPLEEETTPSRQWFVLWASLLSGSPSGGKATLAFLVEPSRCHTVCVSVVQQTELLTLVHTLFSNNPTFVMQQEATLGIGPNGWTLLARRLPPGIQQWSIEGRDNAPLAAWDIRPIFRKALGFFMASPNASEDVQELIDRLGSG